MNSSRKSSSEELKYRRHSFRLTLWGILIPCLILVSLFLGFAFFFSFPVMERHLIDSKESQLRYQVSTAYSLLEHYESLYRQEELNLEEAQRQAKETLRTIRYGEDRENYFFIADNRYTSVMHPLRPSREGQDLSQVQDVNGVYYIKELVDQAVQGNQGLVEYQWYIAGPDSETVPKLSYAMYFEPWQWMIGSGIYIHDIEAALQAEKIQTYIMLCIFILIAALLIWMILSLSLSVEKKRQTAEQNLKLSEKRFRSLFEKNRDAILIIRPPNWNYSEVNRAACKLFAVSSKEEFSKLTPAELSPQFQPDGSLSSEKAGSYIKEAIEEGGAFFEWTHCRLDGTPFTATVQISAMELPDGFALLGTIRDISAQKKLEERLLHSQKMESVGKLAGGVAHDFNNILGGISGAAEILSGNLKDDPENLELINMILEAAQRTSGITQKLLSFSRKGKMQNRAVEINGLIQEMLNLLGRSLDPKIQLSFQGSREQVYIEGDPGQLENALLNLCLNARDAMVEGGKISIRCFDCPESVNPGLQRDQGMFCIEISDTGPGIPEEIQDKIFDPYFSTKAPGKGNGLGLAAVLGCIEEHGGTIDLRSGKDQGTTFILHMPRVFPDNITE